MVGPFTYLLNLNSSPAKIKTWRLNDNLLFELLSIVDIKSLDPNLIKDNAFDDIPNPFQYKVIKYVFRRVVISHDSR